jgi:hypothetical protein
MVYALFARRLSKTKTAGTIAMPAAISRVPHARR